MALLLLTGMAAAGSSVAPSLIGFSRGKLVALDPRTLERLPTPEPLPVGPLAGRLPRLALSPDGARLVVLRQESYDNGHAGEFTAIVVNRLRLRVLRRVRAGERAESSGVQDVVWSKRGSLIFVNNQAGDADRVFGRCAHLDIDGSTEFSAGIAARTPDGLVVLSGACDEGSSSSSLLLTSFSPDETDRDIRVALDPATFVAMAVDAHRNRLFLVSSTGSIAVASLRTGHIEYHPVALPAPLSRITGDAAWRVGWAERAAWAGSDHLAVWGPGGLTLIDTRDWSARLVDPTATDVVVAPNAIVAWNRNAATGLTVFAPDGAVRFRALAGHTVLGVGVSARYAYVLGGGRFSLDLRTGGVTGPLRSRAKLVLPDLLEIP